MLRKAALIFTCKFCNRDLPHRPVTPGLREEFAWERLARFHDPLCEWVCTRGHQLSGGLRLAALQDGLEAVQPAEGLKLQSRVELSDEQIDALLRILEDPD